MSKHPPPHIRLAAAVPPPLLFPGKLNGETDLVLGGEMVTAPRRGRPTRTTSRRGEIAPVRAGESGLEGPETLPGKGARRIS